MIAANVAKHARCGNFEDFDTAGDATWVYTCQRNDEKSYAIAVFASDLARRSWTTTHAGQLYLVENSYGVAPGSRPGRAPEPSDLDPFTNASR